MRPSLDAAVVQSESARLIESGHDLERQARLDEARDEYELALRALTPEEAARFASSILRWISRTYQRQARYDDALDCLTVSLVVAESFSDGAGIGHATNLLAIIRWQQGDLDEAKRLYLEAREWANRSGEAKLGAMTAQNLGVIASVRGESEQALRYFESSLREYRGLGLAHDVCIALNNLGLLQHRREEWEQAERNFREALGIADSLGDIEVATQLEVNLAGIMVARHQWAPARLACERALLLAKARGVEGARGEAHKLSGIVAREIGELVAAEADFGEAFDIANARKDLLLQAEVERERAVLYRSNGRNRNTLQSLNRAHRLFSQLQARNDLADIDRQTRFLEADFVEVARRWGETTESKDRYTQGHCERVADVACTLAAAIELEDRQMFWFRIGALLHDVGKLIIPGEVLNKPGRLTKEEWELMKRHPLAGVELLSEVEFPWDLLPMVRSHHECWDGSGYPDGLAKEEIPLTARIVCLADVYDALTTERSYKKAFTHVEAMDIMRRDVGRQFDPGLFPIFERVTTERRTTSGRSAPVPPPVHPTDAPTAAPHDEHGARDDLTGVLTRRAFADRVGRALAGAGETCDGMPLGASLIVVDIDHFKQVNDTFGHLQGDAVLRSVASALREGARAGDMVARFAGDEFLLFLPNTISDEAVHLAEHHRMTVERMRIPLSQSEEGSVGVSLSVGVASAPGHGSTFESLFAAADAALYEAKRRGRNVVAVAGEDASEGKPRMDTDRFFGRDRELARLVTHLEKSVRGDLQVVAVVGEAGIGKTTLLRRLEPEVRLRTGAVVFGRSLEPDVRPPYGPWVEAISALHRMGAVPPRAWRELPRIVPLLRDGTTDYSGPGGDKYELLDEIVEYFRVAVAARPLVVVLDDMQWGDSASWDALEHMMAQLDGMRLMLCLTIRSEESDRIAVSRRRISRSERYHEMRLGRLEQAEVTAWVSDVMHQANLGDELPSLLFRFTEGNPLFVVQVLRELVAEGAIWYGGKRWEWNRIEKLELPTAVDDLLSRRLSRLSPTALRVLTVGAVLGRSFDAKTVQQAAGVGDDAFLDALDEGMNAGVITVVDSTNAEHFAFAHGLLAEALRRAANPRRLQRTQRRVAEVLEQTRPHALNEIAVLYDQGGDATRAYLYALDAGARAAAVYALDDAIAAYRIAIRRAPKPGERLAARFALIDVTRLAARYADGDRLCGEILEDGESLTPPQRITVERIRLQLRVLQGEDPSATLERAAELLATAESVDADRECIELLSILSETHAREHDHAESERLARKALALARELGDDALLADARVRVGTTLIESAPAAALDEFARAIELYAVAGNLFGRVRCLVNSGIAHARAGAARSAEDSYLEALRLAEDAHVTDLGGLASLNLGVLYLRQGEFDDAEQQFSRAHQLFTRVRNGPRRLAALYNQANLARERGDSAEALGLYESAARLADELKLRHVRAAAIAGTGLAALSLGMHEQADAALAKLHWLLADLGERSFPGTEIVEAFLLHAALLRRELADAAIARAARAIEELSAREDYSYVWLVAECAPVLTDYRWPNAQALVAHALATATRIGAASLIRRLTAVGDAAGAGTRMSLRDPQTF